MGHAALLAAGVAAGGDNDLLHRRVTPEHGFDFPELDAESADLDLMIDPTKELDVPVGAITRQISGAVKAPTGAFAEGIGNELLGGERGTIEVAARQTDPADAQLARHANRQTVGRGRI